MSTGRNYWNDRLPQNQRRTPAQVAEYLLAHRHITESGCWEWTKCLSRSGYGKFKWKPYGDLRVHRVAAMLWLGMDANAPLLVCHRCDNPKCFNPEHLFLGTGKDNQRDCVQKNRNRNKQKTHCKHGHEFSPGNTWLDKTGARHCRECHRTTELHRQQRRRVRQ